MSVSQKNTGTDTLPFSSKYFKVIKKKEDLNLFLFENVAF